jgi:hypothetical protein
MYVNFSDDSRDEDFVLEDDEEFDIWKMSKEFWKMQTRQEYDFLNERGGS